MRFRFNDGARGQLEAIGVIAEQITALEAVIPSCRAWLSPLPTRANVRQKLSANAQVFAQAATATRRLLSDPLKAESEATRHVLYAWFAQGHNSAAPLEAALATLTELQAACHDALRSVPTEQRRRSEARIEPIREIDNALLFGWGKRPDPNPRQAYPFVPSYGAKSPFLEVVAICYEAVTGEKDKDQVRAIRNYLR